MVNKDIKKKLKQRLIEIPRNHSAFREICRLANDIGAETKYVEFYLKELCELGLLKRKIQYICPTCNEITTMDDELLAEFLNEDGYLECDNCLDLINPKKDRTGYIYYDVLDYDKLANW